MKVFIHRNCSFCISWVVSWTTLLLLIVMGWHLGTVCCPSYPFACASDPCIWPRNGPPLSPVISPKLKPSSFLLLDILLVTAHLLNPEIPVFTLDSLCFLPPCIQLASKPWWFYIPNSLYSSLKLLPWFRLFYHLPLKFLLESFYLLSYYCEGDHFNTQIVFYSYSKFDFFSLFG